MKRLITIVGFVVFFSTFINAQNQKFDVFSSPDGKKENLINPLNNKGRNEVLQKKLLKYQRELSELNIKTNVRSESNLCLEADSLALVAIYNKMNGTNWTMQDNWLSDQPVKDWWGITVENNRVTAIDFYIDYSTSQNVSGNLADELWTLTGLELLKMKDNTITGTLSADIQNLTNLTQLDLSRNEISGNIPVETGSLSELSILNLGSNQLTGNLPSELANLSKLTKLILWNNQLSGDIPFELSNLTYLSDLTISENQFTGTIPPELGNMPNLTRLLLNDNELEGTIPEELGDLLNLEDLALSGNNLTGAIPSSLGNLTKITGLHLDRNQLTGTLPPELGNLNDLYHLSLQYNELEGAIPPEMGNYTNMDYFFVEYNNFTELPDLTGLTTIFMITVQENNLDFGDLEQAGVDWSIDEFYYAQQGYAPQPDTIKNGDQLTLTANIGGTGNEYIWLKNGTAFDTTSINNITVTNSSSDYYSCKISNAQFPELILETYEVYSGETSHGVAIEEYNALVALYDATDGDNWKNKENWMTEANVEEWYGITVEGSRVRQISLEENNLTGILPSDIQFLDKLVYVKFNKNNLGGELPAELGDLSELEDLYLYHNEFTGAIPSELGNLSSLYALGLSGNKFEGAVPASLNNLSFCFALLLDDNNLDSLPDLSDIGSSYAGLYYFYAQENQFTFADFENTGYLASEIPNFTYTPQDILSQQIDTVGSTVTLTVISESTTNDYQWMRNGEIYTGETDSILTYDVTDESTYYCMVTNATYPDLTLYTMAVGANIIQGVKIQDYDALVALYNSTNGESWTDNENWLSESPVYTWNGVTVNGSRVTGIELYQNNLSGTLTPEVGNLDSLKVLYIYDNESITGTIPAEIGSLTALEKLAFRNEQFTGAIPEELGNLVNLKYLYLSNNNFSQLPDFSELTNLSVSYIHENQFNFTDLDSAGIDWTVMGTDYAYAPQQMMEAPEFTIDGEEVLLSVNDSCIDNEYMWYKDTNLIATTDTNSLLIPFVDSTNYSCTITNERYPDLTLNTDTARVILPRYEVTFSVSDGTNPIVGAEVSLSNGDVLTTDQDGNTVIVLPDDEYDYTITKDGYLTHSETLTVSGEALTKNITLHEIHIVTFHITVDSDPVENVQVEIAGNVFSTDANGNLDVELVDGTYGYYVEIEGYQSLAGEIVVDGADETVEIALTPLYTVQFNVTDGNNPLPEVEIAFGEDTLITDFSGIALVDTVNGTYTCAFSKDGYQSQSSELTVDGADLNIEFTMQPLYTITFTILDEASNPIEGVTVTIGDRNLITNTNGVAHIDTINGNYDYVVSMVGYEQTQGTITVNDANTNQNITLQEAAVTYAVTFTINDGTNPLGNASVTMSGYGETLTNDSGIAEFTDVSSGTYSYSVSLEGYNDADGNISVVDQNVNETITLIDTTTGIEQMEVSKLSVYPNPASGWVIVKSEVYIETIQLMSVVGEVVLSKKVAAHESELNIDNLNAGVYLMRVNSDNDQAEIIRIVIK